MHIIEINLTIEKQSVLDLKAELQKTMDAAWVATIRDVLSQAKDAESKHKAYGVPSKAADPEKDPSKDKA